MEASFLKAKLRLNNDAVIQLENSDLIRISVDLNDFKIFHKDILLFLPDFFDWCSVEDFLNTIPEGKEQILKVLKELQSANILQQQVSDSKEMLSSNEGLPQFESSTETIYFNIHNHHLMIKDYVRAIAYRFAIEANVTPDDIVLELGCGSGILTFFASRAGAKKQFAIEINKPLVDKVTRPMAKANKYDDKITFLLGNSLNIPSNIVTPKATVFIAEILGDGIFNENILTYTIDARDRFLAPGAKLLPKGLDVYIFGYENPKAKTNYIPRDLKNLLQVKSSNSDSMYVKYETYVNKMLTSPCKAIYIDLETIKEPYFVAKGELEVNFPGNLNGCCIYFVAHIDDNNLLSNSPWSPQISWSQQIFNINPPISVNNGDKIPFTLNYDGFISIVLGE